MTVTSPEVGGMVSRNWNLGADVPSALSFAEVGFSEKYELMVSFKPLQKNGITVSKLIKVSRYRPIHVHCHHSTWRFSGDSEIGRSSFTVIAYGYGKSLGLAASPPS